MFALDAEKAFRSGLNPRSFLILNLLAKKGGTITHVSKKLETIRQLVTNDLEKLVKLGYVVEDPEHFFSLTPEGVKFLTYVSYDSTETEDGPGKCETPEEEPS